MIPARRPAHAAPPTYTGAERERRQKWLERQRRKGNHHLTLHDAPPHRDFANSTDKSGRSDDWVTPCRSCGRAGLNWDLEPEWRDGTARLVRYCRYCRVNSGCSFEPCRKKRTRRSAYCFGHEKQLQRGGPLKPLRQYRSGVHPCRSCGAETTPGKRSKGVCNKCRMRRVRAAT